MCLENPSTSQAEYDNVTGSHNLHTGVNDGSLYSNVPNTDNSLENLYGKLYLTKSVLQICILGCKWTWWTIMKCIYSGMSGKNRISWLVAYTNNLRN